MYIQNTFQKQESLETYLKHMETNNIRSTETVIDEKSIMSQQEQLRKV